MKRIGAMLLSVFVLLFALNVPGRGDKKEGPPPAAAGILRCSLSGAAYVVTAASFSSGSPSVAIGSVCGQTLADLTKAGFGLSNTQIEQNTQSLVYTLINASSGD
jgi:hypothetical protein